MRLFIKLKISKSLPVAAVQAGISVASAYRLQRDLRAVSAKKPPRGRRRPDPLVDIFESKVILLLQSAPSIRHIAVFDELRRRHPDLTPGVRRTLEHRIRAWRALHGEGREVMFRQTHEAVRMGLSDFTEMADLGVAVAGAALAHQPYHFRTAPRSVRAGATLRRDRVLSYEGPVRYDHNRCKAVIFTSLGD